MQSVRYMVNPETGEHEVARIACFARTRQRTTAGFGVRNPP